LDGGSSDGRLVVDTIVVEEEKGRVTPLKANNSDMVEATIGQVVGGRRLRISNRGRSCSRIGVGRCEGGRPAASHRLCPRSSDGIRVGVGNGVSVGDGVGNGVGERSGDGVGVGIRDCLCVGQREHHCHNKNDEESHLFKEF